LGKKRHGSKIQHNNYENILFLSPPLAILKKTIAILLLCIHLFNLGGYHLFFAVLDSRQSARNADQLDRGQYDESDLVELKIPYPLPYACSWNGYERYEGEMELNGVHYSYVKRKLSNDTLYLQCLPNAAKTKLVSAHNAYGILVSDASRTASEKKSANTGLLQKAFSSEYNQGTSNFDMVASLLVFKPENHFRNCLIPTRDLPTLHQPPKIASL